MHYAFVHPDFGIGGAERLVLDQALALRELGHSVDIFTTSYDKRRCFDDSKKFRIDVVGQDIPRTFLGYGYIAICWIRMLLICIYMMLNQMDYDAVFVDQVSPVVPILRLWFRNVIFYCHYPDQLLANHETRVRRVYRLPFDLIEGLSMSRASLLLANSEFTKQAMIETFAASATRWDFDEIRVLYPCVHMEKDESIRKKANDCDFHFVSINRYERKKNIGLAIESAAHLRDICPARFRITIAGGFDDRLSENVEYYDELKRLSDSLDIPVQMQKSITDEEKSELLQSADCVIYTPSNEHFGIVPLDAMAHGKAVIAVNSGGPRETIVHGETGFLLDPDAKIFAQHMRMLVESRELADEMGAAGLRRVRDVFSFEHFTTQMNEILESLYIA